MEHYIDHFPGIHLKIKNKDYRYFGGTAYLGLQTDPKFQEIFIANVKNYGTAYGASRKSNIRLDIYDKAECFLANWTGSGACATLSSGYLAGQLVANLFNHPDYQPFYAPNCHTALFSTTEKGKYNKPYATYTSLGIALRQHLEFKNAETPVVFLDAIDFSTTNYPNFDGIKSLPLEDIVLVIDDSHGIGVVGPEGAGVFPLLSKLNAKELLVCCSLGKAMGVQGGAIFCSKERHKKLTDTDFYAGASPVAPAYLPTLLDGWDLIQQKREQLHHNISTFSAGVENLKNLISIPNYPAFSYSDNLLTEYLFDNRVIVTHFAYPNEAADLSSRIVLSAAHKNDDIQYLVDLLCRYTR
ncbi:aminotransferase class I/II-fold pyridoxal phosphate-dependent enzyme [Muriicola sp. Z0-33]|uniref:aminotransferase class I/II-fold pyridoxal phosphate-dependent enzyme n=1 Tax=Muriicola sp. Z0-33 TaxID=2816957 RepID=UPI002237F790|nr:aminotransferase class I/II-fold pyridoxal phosphate-dependent enzyme [Muriicola sp. Z0-33]MCW5516965.1 aminotransferase class I/II-fold pyridoxal phosphate-dependent enzyme [Muriicola sp. Z0-33]